jgi:Tfp pilus assembly protein PilW
MVAVAITGLIVAPCVTVYLATQDSWAGTAALADVQRDAWFVIDLISRNTRGASAVNIPGRVDSMEVVFHTSSGDSVVGRYYVDGQNRLVDINGTVLVRDVDTVCFTSADGKTVNMDVTLTDGMGTPTCGADDQSVLLSSSVVCRNK